MIKVSEFLDEQTVAAAKDSPCIHNWIEVWIHSYPESECTGAKCRSCNFRFSKDQWNLYKEGNHDKSSASD